MLVAMLFAGRLVLLASHIPLDYNEGWNAFHTRALMHSGALYPSADSLIGNNYPPLSFLIVGLFARTLGIADLILAGRLVSLVAMLAVAIQVALLTYRLAYPGHSRHTAAVFAPLLFLAYVLTEFRAYAVTADPQWIGHALMLAGLLALLWHRPNPDADNSLGIRPSRIPAIRALPSALLVLAGGMVKHNLIALPAAAGLWLLFYDRRALTIWIAVALTGLAALFALDQTRFGGFMLTSVLDPPRTYSLARMAVHAAIALPLLPLLACAFSLLPLRRRDNRLDALLVGSLFGLAIGVVQGAGAGVDVNAFFEALILLAVAGPLGFVQWRKSTPSRRLMAMQALPLAVMMPWGLWISFDEIRTRAAAEADARAMVTAIAATPGLAACEMLALCYWAGKDFSVDFFRVGQVYALGRDNARLDAVIAKRDFAAVQVEATDCDPRIGPVAALLHTRYRPALTQRDRTLYRCDDCKRLHPTCNSWTHPGDR